MMVNINYSKPYCLLMKNWPLFFHLGLKNCIYISHVRFLSRSKIIFSSMFKLVGLCFFFFFLWLFFVLWGGGSLTFQEVELWRNLGG